MSTPLLPSRPQVTLYTRVWIEMVYVLSLFVGFNVTLYTRVWIEITRNSTYHICEVCHPLHEGVDWNSFFRPVYPYHNVTLYTRVWIEMISKPNAVLQMRRVTLYTRVWIEM